MNLANCLPRGILSCPTKRISTRRRLELYTGHCDIKSISLYSRALQVIPCIYPRRVCQLANSTNVSDPWTWLVAVNGPQNLQYSGPEIPDSKIFLSGPANIPHALYEVKSAWWELTPSVCQPFGPLSHTNTCMSGRSFKIRLDGADTIEYFHYGQRGCPSRSFDD